MVELRDIKFIEISLVFYPPHPDWVIREVKKDEVQ